MSTISDIKKDMEFYRDFSSLIDALKAITISQFQTLERKLKTFDDFNKEVEGFFGLLNLKAVNHPFVDAGNLPQGAVAVTSDAGLIGGLNSRIVNIAVSHLKGRDDKLAVVGLQGHRFAGGHNIDFKAFPGIGDKQGYELATQVRDYIVKEVLAGRLGAVKLIFPFALSITNQRVVELDLLPCTKWPKKDSSSLQEGDFKDQLSKSTVPQDLIIESSLADIVEYLVYLWIGHKLYEVFQFSRLAEYAARVVHLEESAQKVKEIESKLRLKYFRQRHEVIDQQMRELFSARSLYAS
jgi:ATP synthase F1 gamma subunit